MCLVEIFIAARIVIAIFALSLYFILLSVYVSVKGLAISLTQIVSTLLQL